GQIEFHNFTGKEEDELIHMINTKKYNFFTSWLTGKGKYHEEALGHDKLVIVDFLQNEGFADAQVDIDVTTSSKTGKLVVNITAHKGEIFHIGRVSFSGNELYDNAEVEKVLKIKDGAIYSPKEIEATSQAIKDLYGKKGYIEANVQYRLELSPNSPVYNIHYDIEEHEQFKIGLIRVVGNSCTNTNVILRESLLVPGEVFDSRKLKATEQRVEAIGYFKSVNVYPVRTPEDRSLGPNYRDVIIEVEEQSTGNLSLFFGFSTMNELFGGLELTENNFNIKGLASWWRTGMAGLRGNGEYAHVKATIGSKEQSYVLSWLTPYLHDTRWRLGFDVGYSDSKLTSKNYNTKKVFGSINANYPLSSNITWGMNTRLSNAVIKVTGDNVKNEEEQKQSQNSGLVLGFGTSLGYNSTNSSYKATRGIRSNVSGEIAGLRRHSTEPRAFPFLKGELNNTFYYPVWKKGTFKMRADARFIYPLGDGNGASLPVSERYFLGGETTVRGYRSFSLGPKLEKKDGVP
ncbi:MAG: POTRA domain-containing protein, partial [Simkaniaceae bacterium]|nr:POTRA domain-containing protein [Simkaniaceae bacterium]